MNIKNRILPCLVTALVVTWLVPLAVMGQEGSDPKELSRAKAPDQKPGLNQKKASLTPPRMILTSTAFTAGEAIPARQTCDGKNLSPPLAWYNVPAGTQAFALVCDDPDAPMGTWDHWVIFNLPALLDGLPEGVTVETDMGPGVRRGINGWNRTGYGGPCPPAGAPHRYYFVLYALSAPVLLPEKATKQQLQEAVKPLVLDTASLMGTYQR